MGAGEAKPGLPTRTTGQRQLGGRALARSPPSPSLCRFPQVNPYLNNP